MNLKILKYPDPILRKTAEPVKAISKEVFELVDNMIETMLKEEGVGLAATQVGSLLRIFTLNTTPHEEQAKPVAFINPVILKQEGEVVEEEGCLSFPELYLKIKRSEWVQLQAKNLYNEDLVYETSGLLARAVQHEIDHLNGVLIIDHPAEVDEEKVKAYLAKLKETGDGV
ncbi:MAG TPA: peptide deformylase [candidate division WOR-3 bacterium]|uniref:Peptide deformylase n=1 Tax=candidate division WOR-3 bacterium TaxID=2052148 RepID=A0A9C9K0P8_UNCW3|nr:peptide deformylase [candidate division WOR-3 bacterium]